MQLTSLDSDGFGVGLMFHQEQGHHAHAVLAITPERRWVLLESLEYDSAGEQLTDWPPSPPLQQLSVESRGEQREVALLLGMAGKSHWSLAAETRGAERRIVLDVACRVVRPPNFLGSTYAVRGAATEQPHAWTPPPSAPQFGGHRRPGLRLHAEMLDAQARSDQGRWQVEPLAVDVATPATLTWKYAFRLDLD